MTKNTSGINSWFYGMFLNVSRNFNLTSQKRVMCFAFSPREETINVVFVPAAWGESSREREAGVGATAPPGPGDPAFRASQRAGWELPTRPTSAGKEGRRHLDAEYALKLFSKADFLPNTCTQTGGACAVHVRSTQSGIKEFTEHYHFPVLLLCFLSRL